MEKENKKDVKKIIAFAIIACLMLVSIICTYPISKGFKYILDKWFDVKTQGLLVHYIDVGQGDAIAIQFPNREIMLIDTGPKDSQNLVVDYLQNQVLKSNKDKVIDYMVLTHSDIDHSGGSCAVFSNFDVKNFYRPSVASADEDAKAFLTSVSTLEYAEVIKQAYQEPNINIEIISDGLFFMAGDVKIEFFGPLKAYDTTNEICPLIKISYNNKTFLFAGDVQGEAEADLLNKYGNTLKADVLKVGHHGSLNATSEEFLNAVKPCISVISVGENLYGHPSNNVLLRLENIGSEVLRTDCLGDIRILCNKNKIEVLNDNAIMLYDFVEWWIIGIVIEIAVIVNLVVAVVRIAKRKKIERDKYSSI